MDQQVYLGISIALMIVFVWGFSQMHKTNNRFEDQATMLQALLKRDEKISASDIASAAYRANKMDILYQRDHEAVIDGFTKVADEVPEKLENQSQHLAALNSNMVQLNQLQDEALRSITHLSSLTENTASSEDLLLVRREQSNAQQQRSELHGQMKEILATYDQRFSVIETAVQSLGNNQQNIAQSVQQSQSTLSNQLAQFKNEVLNQ